MLEPETEFSEEPIAPDEGDEKQDIATLDDLNTFVPGGFPNFSYNPENPQPDNVASGPTPLHPVTLNTSKH